MSSLNDVIKFGKHRGLTLSQICDKDPGYIIWLSKGIMEVPKVLVRRAENNMPEKEEQSA